MQISAKPWLARSMPRGIDVTYHRFGATSFNQTSTGTANMLHSVIAIPFQGSRLPVGYQFFPATWPYTLKIGIHRDAVRPYPVPFPYGIDHFALGILHPQLGLLPGRLSI